VKNTNYFLKLKLFFFRNYCNASTEKELVWVGLSKNLLYPGIISLATEFIPVLLVVHWLLLSCNLNN